MTRIVYPAFVLAAGLALSQFLFFILVLRSNLILHGKMLAMETAGYLVVPNALVIPSLTSIPAAFNGALFFTFTTGAGICLAAMAGAWIFRRLFMSRTIFGILLAAAWLISIATVNFDGLTLTGTVPLAVIPPFVFLFCISRMPARPRPQERLALAIQVLVIIVIVLAWFPKTDRAVFIDIRDNILLSNSVGKRINDFYYRFTLYPAKLMKTPSQKLMAPACTGNIKDEALRRRLETVLAANDFLPLETGPCDLIIGVEEDLFVLSDNNKALLTAPQAAFFQDPGGILGGFSERVDATGPFRTMTFVSLFTALPLSLFLIVHAFFSGLLFLVPSLLLRHAAASLLCLLIGIGSVAPLYLSPDHPLTGADIRRGLSSDDWRQQRNALMTVLNEKIDPMEDPIRQQAVRLYSSPHVPVRYWYASALGNSRHPQAYRLLLEMTDDPHPNVACMAYSGLGRFGSKRAVNEILKRITISDHWYVQWYAYRSLRQLGWTQTISVMN
jgi:hypothetical protein